MRSGESECPFCGVALDLSATPARPMPCGRLGRTALFAFGAAIAGATILGCGSDDSSGSGGTGGGVAGSGSAAGDAGQAGAAGSGGTAGMAGASGNGGTAASQPIYGAPPMP